MAWILVTNQKVDTRRWLRLAILGCMADEWRVLLSHKIFLHILAGWTQGSRTILDKDKTCMQALRLELAGIAVDPWIPCKPTTCPPSAPITTSSRRKCVYTGAVFSSVNIVERRRSDLTCELACSAMLYVRLTQSQDTSWYSLPSYVGHHIIDDWTSSSKCWNDQYYRPQPGNVGFSRTKPPFRAKIHP